MKQYNHPLEQGDIFLLPVDKARPTQFAVGMVAVDCKKRVIEEAHNTGKLQHILCEEGHLVPVVVGPNQELFITDHHHLSSAIWRANIPLEAKNVYAYVLHDWSDKKGDSFWREMIENSLVWLYDDKGDGPLNPHMLPRNIGDILNDPYRSLSRWLRDCGCYSKNELKDKKEQICTNTKYLPESRAKAFFIEFRWANFLRQNVKLKLKHTDFTQTCATMPYSPLYLSNEAEALLKAFDVVVQLIGCRQLTDVTYDKHGCLIKK